MLGIAIMFLTPLKTVELTVVKVDKNWRNVQKRLNAYNNWDLDE